MLASLRPVALTWLVAAVCAVAAIGVLRTVPGARDQLTPLVVVWLAACVAGLVLATRWLRQAARAGREHPPGAGYATRWWLARGRITIAAGALFVMADKMAIGLAVVFAPALPRGVPGEVVAGGLIASTVVQVLVVASEQYCRERAMAALPPDPPPG